MRKRTLFSVILIFLFALSLLAAGLYVGELGLREVSGVKQPTGAFAVRHDGEDGWVLVFAGEEWLLPAWLPGL